VTRLLRKILYTIALLVLVLALGTLAINVGMVMASAPYIRTDSAELPEKTTVLVLGSQTRGTTLSRVLEDRVVAGIELMDAGKGQKLLLSGDHGDRYYDEVNAMRLYVLAHAPAIADADIFMDHAGFNTYDSMYRARDVFEVRDLIIVTQEFHAGRAVFLARNLGLDAVAYAQSQAKFSLRLRMSWYIREYLARVKAFIYVIFKPGPRYLGDKIPITGDGRDTWI
jgi:SanA protein